MLWRKIKQSAEIGVTGDGALDRVMGRPLPGAASKLTELFIAPSIPPSSDEMPSFLCSFLWPSQAKWASRSLTP